MRPISNLIRQSYLNIKPCVLSLSYDGHFEEFLQNTDADIYELRVAPVKPEYKGKISQIPFKNENGQINLLFPDYVDIDLVVYFSGNQEPIAKQIAQIMQIPIISVTINHAVHDTSAKYTVKFGNQVKEFDSKDTDLISEFNKIFQEARKLVFKL